MPPSSPFLHVRQFIAGASEIVLGAIQPRLRMTNGLHLSAHPGLDATLVQRGRIELLSLGQLLDPREPHHDDRQVLEALIESAASFDELEARLARLGGRWLLFATIDGQSRLYPDATGTRSAFFGLSSRGDLWMASQPGLLEEPLATTCDRNLRIALRAAVNAGCWPCDRTPYPGVRQLLPNHYLDLSSGRVVRFWPIRVPVVRSVDDAAASIATLLHGTIAATIQRGPTALPLTGGYDSRTLLAAAKSLRSSLTCFSTAHLSVPDFDIRIPRRLGKRLGVPVAVLTVAGVPDGFASAVRANVAEMWWDEGEHAIHTYGSLQNRFVLSGLTSEVARCWYYNDGVHPATLDPEDIARRARFGSHPLAVDAFRDWLAGVPRDCGITVLDLLFWEHRAGNWASMLFTAMDTCVEPVLPFNSRELLEISLGVGVEHRRRPYGLHRRICAITTPEVLEFPFNHSWTQTARQLLSSALPWRLRAAMLRRKKRRFGLDDGLAERS